MLTDSMFIFGTLPFDFGIFYAIFLVLRIFKRLCKTDPPCESYSVELIFALLIEKVLTLYLVCGQSKDTQLAGSLETKWGTTR